MNTQTNYPFDLVRFGDDVAVPDKQWLRRRPFTELGGTFAEDAALFVPGTELEAAINTAIAVGEPLLITGEAGTGKTQTAYYVARKLGVATLHFQVKSDSVAGDLLYHFDTVRYFHDAHLRKADQPLDKADYVERRALWEAFEAAEPCVLLIDEIDKAPRDFPNDLLHELDRMEFTVKETQHTVRATKSQRPVVMITSNSERRLPEPFLRRCVYHHIRFDDDLVKMAVQRHRDEYRRLDDKVVGLALRRFLELRAANPRKRPATGELLVWLRVLALAADARPERLLSAELWRTPYLGVLLKDHQDMEDLGGPP